MDIIKEYQRLTGANESGTQCATCANAIWRVAYDDDSDDAYHPTRSEYSLRGHCTAIGKPITAYVCACSSYAASDAAQRADFAGL